MTVIVNGVNGVTQNPTYLLKSYADQSGSGVARASVINFTTKTPPTSQNVGDAYVVASGATGGWAGKDNQLAVWQVIAGSVLGWAYYTPKAGWSVYDTATSSEKVYNGFTWGAGSVQSGTLSASSGSSQVGFVQTGTGAVARTVQDELRDAVKPEQFGCVGDGVTNDATNFQRALTYAASTGKIVQLVSGKTYNCAGVTLTVACKIFGNGATIKGYMDVSSDDIVLRDFWLIGTNSSIGIFLHGSTTVPTRYYRYKVQNIRITFDTGVANNNTFGIYASNIDNLEVRGCNLLYGIHLIGCTDYILDGNILDGDNYNNYNELCHASYKSVGQIVNNTFKNSLDNYIDLFSSGAKTVISNNRFLGNKLRVGAAVELKVSLSDDSGNTSSDTNGWEEQIVFTGNYFGNTVAQVNTFNTIVSIYYVDNRASPSFSWANTPRNIVIANNIFDGFDTSALTSGYGCGIYLYSVNAAIVSGNVFRNMNKASGVSDISSCVWVEACQDVVIEGNRMNYQNATALSLHSACTNISVLNNHMLDDLNAGYSLAYGIRITKEGSRPDPTIDYSKFVGNTIYCTTSAFRQLYYAAGYMNDCLVSGNVFREQTDFYNINRCVISGNKFYVGASRIQAAQLGNIGSICAHNTFVNNQVESNTTTQKPGVYVYRMRGSNINNNTIRNATYGIVAVGTNTAGELDYLNIKDNFSISQTQTNFPAYSSMAAGDTASLQAVNNQKIT